jgi:uncharacterized membrane protein
MTPKNFFVPTSRIEAFSDGVFAIVITLLAFQFKLPAFTEHVSISKNFSELVRLTPNVLGFIFSFLFVAVFWVNHHQLYHSIKEANRTLLYYNIHLLFWITMIPFPVAMIGEHPRIALSAMALGFVLLMCSVAALMLRRYSYFTAKLVTPTLSAGSLRDGINKNVIAIVLNIIAIFAAIYSVYLAYSLFFVVLGLFMIPQKLERKRSPKKIE